MQLIFPQGVTVSKTEKRARDATNTAEVATVKTLNIHIFPAQKKKKSHLLSCTSWVCPGLCILPVLLQTATHTVTDWYIHVLTCKFKGLKQPTHPPSASLSFQSQYYSLICNKWCLEPQELLIGPISRSWPESLQEKRLVPNLQDDTP